MSNIDVRNSDADMPAALLRQQSGSLPALEIQAEGDGPAISAIGSGNLMELRNAAGTNVLTVNQVGTVSGSAAVAPGLILPIGSGAITTAAAVWPAANRALFARFALSVAGIYRYINWICAVESGNVQYGIVRLSGTDRTTYTRIAGSGVIACPAAGAVRGDVGATYLAAGDYAAFMWADNTTFQTRRGSSTDIGAYRVAGLHSSQASGVGATGTLTWSDPYVTLTIEADV